jgi:glycerol uptake facilitator-like aquaporin
VAVNYGVASGGSAPALAQFAACLLIGPISNAHINPAVTIAVLLSQGMIRENAIFTVMIWISQFIGATLGILWVRFSAVVKANEFDQTEILSPIARIAPHEAYVMDDGSVYYGFIFMVEIFATFMFVSCCLSLSHQGSTEKPINAITVSFALYMSI